jgi:hypothetical protein
LVSPNRAAHFSCLTFAPALRFNVPYHVWINNRWHDPLSDADFEEKPAKGKGKGKGKAQPKPKPLSTRQSTRKAAAKEEDLEAQSDTGEGNENLWFIFDVLTTVRSELEQDQIPKTPHPGQDQSRGWNPKSKYVALFFFLFAVLMASRSFCECAKRQILQALRGVEARARIGRNRKCVLCFRLITPTDLRDE